jgi:hypothetical protein
MPTKKRAVDQTTVTARLIQKCLSTDPGAVKVGGGYLRALPLNGLNGLNGWQQAHYERWQGTEGPWTMTLPLTAGPDGRLHIDRFLQRIDPLFMPGDEWVELRRDSPPKPLNTGVLVNAPAIGSGSLQVGGYDAFWLLNLTRETEAGFWAHAPRDALEHYTRVWAFDVGANFPEPGAAPVSGTGPTTTGSFTYQNADTTTGQPVCRLTGSSSEIVVATAPPAIGYASADPYTPWRVEVSMYVPGPLPGGGFVALGGTALGEPSMVIQGNPSVSSGLSGFAHSAGYTYPLAMPGASSLLPGQLDITMEGRERWIFCYINGQLAAVMPMAPTASAPNLTGYSPGVGDPPHIDVQSFSYERGLPFLMRGSDPGDYVLPSPPTPGGLWGEYFDDADLANTNDLYASALNPIRTAYAARVDPAINFTAGSWFPPGPGSSWSARWTGAIFLDLENFDYRLKLASSTLSRLWVGKTRMGEQVCDNWPIVGTNLPLGGATTSPYMRSLFGEVSGWYPIRVEFSTGFAPTVDDLALTLERSDAPGTFSAISPTQLSQYGCYLNQVRRDSHHDTFEAIAQAFGYQFTCQPMSLESGLFPGQVIPRARIGRDRNIVVTENDSTEIGLQSSGEDMAVRIVADAQGIADPSSSAQLSAIVVNYPNARGHIFCATQADSASDITDPGLLQQRLGTLLELRSGTWDQIAARPPGHPMRVEDWPPATTVLPLGFAWEPGDGVLRKMRTIGLVDQTPAQLASVIWDCTPDGIIAPQTSWRIYPRGSYWTLKAFSRQQIAGKRNYQGQLVERSGTFGGRTGTTGDARSPATGAAEQYSRLPLPVDPRKVQSVGLIVLSKFDATIQWTIEVNGHSTGILVNTSSPRPYDVTPYAAGNSMAQPMLVARLTPPGGTFDTVEYMLVAQFAV